MESSFRNVLNRLRTTSEEREGRATVSGQQVCVIANGCPVSRIDGAEIQRLFEANGYTVTDDYEDANIIVFNSCALTSYSQ